VQGMILMAETSFSRLANSFSLILAFSVISIIFSPLRSKAPDSHETTNSGIMQIGSHNSNFSENVGDAQALRSIGNLYA
jgi:hypothetical protein